MWRTETPRLEYIIISVHKSGSVYDENEIDSIIYPSLESLLSEKYFKDISSKQIDELEKYIDFANNKKIYIKSQFDFSIDNKLTQFEAQFIPDIRDSCLLLIKGIDKIRSITEGTERQLLAQGHVSNFNKKILIYIQHQNKVNHNPTYGEICKYMEITSRSIRKRLRALIEYDYLIEIRTGRTKNIMITEKGNNELIVK